MAELEIVEEDPNFDEALQSTTEHIRESTVSTYLSEHARFARQWFIRNATPDMVSEWLVGHGYGPDPEMPENLSSLTDSYAKATHSGRNSVTSELFQDMVICPKKKKQNISNNLSRKELQQHLKSLKEPDLLMELIRDIANELDVDTLCHKILVNVSILTNSDRGSLFLAKGPRGSRYLVAKLFDVTPDSVLQDALDAAVDEEGESRIPPIPFGVGIAGHVALTKECVNIKDAYQDPRFNKDIDTRTGYRTVSVMCQPILNFQGDVIGVAQCINKVTGDHQFTEQDQEVFRKYLTFCGIGVQNAQLFEMSVREFKRNQLLLSLAKSIFEETSSLDRLINKIMVKVEELLQCEKCRVYLVDTEQEDLVFQRLDNLEEKSSTLPPIFKPKKFSRPQDVIFTTIFELRRDEQEVRRPSLKDLSGSEAAHVYFARHVVATEQTFNWSGTDDEIKVVRKSNIAAVPPAFPSEKLKSRILSIPIFNSENKVIGVAQLVNKSKGQVFTDCDINTLEAFSIFCGLGIYNTQMYENASKLMAKQKVALEVLSYHASSSLEETKKLMTTSIPTGETFKLYSFHFSDFHLSDDDTCQAALRMFIDLDLIAKFRIPYQVMCRWILSVKKNYRPVIYHNWRHALNVTQTVFSMLMTGHMRELFTDIEIMALLVACLCHDLDHRGTNNSFQTKIESPLAILYSTSTMEHHHFDQCVMILNSEGNNIFQFLSPEEYKSIISVVESAILSTDLALYFKKKDSFLNLVKSGDPDWTNPQNRELLRGMMMTACDVSAICKPWEVQRKVAELVAGEFFQQGDLEKERLKEQPIAMMDRDKKDELPAMQVGFIDCICLPVYEALVEVQPALSPLLQGCLENRKNWQALANDKHKKETELFTFRNGTNKKTENNRQLNGMVHLPQTVCYIPDNSGRCFKDGGEIPRRSEKEEILFPSCSIQTYKQRTPFWKPVHRPVTV
ncbi:cGMP-specific 3',5'-cyclic phosphodiesterase-like isoform X3 [Argiope bruennichi]|nr:cGMP-specific 3',5'-cyclic phosphodiesterase-like isoform X3 [Argiope bruennichi]XP_055949648.1 cGMP-specific 3',5'-cyclic phosphodiesterase-like isoform X3 [Argiope bruennichi]